MKSIFWWTALAVVAFVAWHPSEDTINAMVGVGYILASALTGVFGIVPFLAACVVLGIVGGFVALFVKAASEANQS